MNPLFTTFWMVFYCGKIVDIVYHYDDSGAPTFAEDIKQKLVEKGYNRLIEVVPIRDVDTIEFGEVAGEK